MAKQRTTIPKEIAAHVRWLSDDTCCICNQKEKGIQIHHIDGDPQNHHFENLAVLCLECHVKTQQKGGFTRKLTPHYVTTCRDKWLKTVVLRREEANKRDIERRVGKKSSDNQPRDKRQSRLDKHQSRLDFIQEASFELEVIFIKSLPKLKTELAQQFKEKIKGKEKNIDIRNARDEYSNALIFILVTLANFYHPEYFEDQSPKEFFEKIMSERHSLYTMVAEPYGRGTGGRISSFVFSSCYIEDLEHLVETMVKGLVYISEFDYDDWQQLWRNVGIFQ